MDKKQQQSQPRHIFPSLQNAYPSSPREEHSFQSSPPSITFHQGRELIPPQTPFARVVMGNETSSNDPSRNANTGASARTTTREEPPPQRPMSNLSVLMNQQQEMQRSLESSTTHTANPPREQPPVVARGTSLEQNRNLGTPNEADSASGPPPGAHLGSSAPSVIQPSQPVRQRAGTVPTVVVAPPSLSRNFSSGGVVGASPGRGILGDRVRRCISSKELGTLAPPSGSPYATMLSRKEALEQSMRQRLQAMRETAAPLEDHSRADESSSTSSRLRREGANEGRNRRRAEHNQAIVNDLCAVVADLFIAESKLLKPMAYGVPDNHSSQHQQRAQVIKSIHTFVSALPTRYALGADTPSEVLLHMRLMAAARSDKTRVAVHIHNMEDDSHWIHTAMAASEKHHRLLRLVTISCNDGVGLLEYITKLLATGGSRVLDADVMLSTDGIVLDRFVVEMSGRLRLDMLSNLIEAFLDSAQDDDGKTREEGSTAGSPSSKSSTSIEPTGALYYHPPSSQAAECHTPQSIREEMQTAIPLTEVLASSSNLAMPQGPVLPKLRRMHSMPAAPVGVAPDLPNVRLPMRKESSEDGVLISISPEQRDGAAPSQENRTMRERRPLVNRPAASDLDNVGAGEHVLDYVTIPSADHDGNAGVDQRIVPLVPFDELMLIETLGSGRVSTIYRAAWQRVASSDESAPAGVQMVALKVAMVNNITGDTSHVDELRREADIAARLRHPNICDLVGVAADSECFCLAYDFCEGGSLLSLLSDASRYYEYLPIALDIANGMAYLHNRQVIHRDLKPSNILLTRDHRAKIADFGMSVANLGQELTAETGTYRYMAPEVIRHESYSSNADVYSFGLCLWQLITREVPFATMTPIQAAYAVAEGRRPPIPASVPRRLQEIIMACWDQDSHRRPSFTYIAMALADYAKMAFSPANVGAQTLQIANEMLATVEGNSTVNVDFTTPVASTAPGSFLDSGNDSHHSNNVGLEIE